MRRKIFTFENHEQLSYELAKELMNSINKKAEEGKNYFIAISGGNTPKPFFKKLSQSPFKENILWKNLKIFWVDERCVPPDDEQSNFGMTKNLLLDKVEIPKENIFRMKGEEIPKIEAERYAGEIINNLPKDNNGLPVFDLMFMGMGNDGHTASLFPGQNLRDISNNICGVGQKGNQKRISLTYDFINNSDRIIFMVTGESKAKLVEEIINEKNKNYPAAKIKSKNGSSEWWLDQQAASKL